MNELDNSAFIQLFKHACEKCFGHPLQNVLTETESKLFCNTIIDKTGLIIGFKSIKNYSAYVLNEAPEKQENPSVATLDTLARYVADAPYTDEVKRKATESHYPYWFAYKEKLVRGNIKEETPAPKKHKRVFIIAPGVALLLLSIWLMVRHKQHVIFTDDFADVSQDSLVKNGWHVKAADNFYWNKRNITTGALTLFTLKGDNWPDSTHEQGIKNLLVREIPGECFTAEVHLEKFIPHQNWQQAGILLMEDTLFKGKTMRLSLAYNDYTGGYPLSKQVIIQAITSLGNNFTKPEEIAHTTLFYLDSITKTPAVLHNLDHSALRIEKHGSNFRMLYADGASGNTAFKEVVSRNFNMQPRYIGIFALKGFVDSAGDMPVHVTFFRLSDEDCEK